ncbi:hypothetical protein T07_5824 [Trichinella nelsoni]|uniref:Uncharacterized protein n=1 Tax=Trichinella nelsoni TaxID=6336 RepID=A0A0V0RAK0_9BILA|nr:hypothetical protein T07_5824 [Trichinella nelsoni]
MYSHRSKRYVKLPEHCPDQQIPDAFRTTMAGEDFLLWQSEPGHWMVHSRLYLNGINSYLPSMPL